MSRARSARRPPMRARARETPPPQVACPATCGECEVEVDDAVCADSTSWYWKKSKYDCDYVAKKSKLCKSKYADESDVSSKEQRPVAVTIFERSPLGKR